MRTSYAADAFFWGFQIIVPKDGTEAFTEEDYLAGLAYLKQVYGAEINTTADVIKDF